MRKGANQKPLTWEDEKKCGSETFDFGKVRVGAGQKPLTLEEEKRCRSETLDLGKCVNVREKK